MTIRVTNRRRAGTTIGAGLLVGVAIGCNPSGGPGDDGVGSGGQSEAGGDSGSGGTTIGSSGGSGGSHGDGGASSTGGSASGGSGSNCARPVGTCSAPVVRVTEVDVGVPIVSYGTEYDTEPVPMVLSALPSGGSRVAWLGSGEFDERVYVAELDCDDRLVGAPLSFPAHDVQDLHADAAGGVLLLTRDAAGSGDDHCGEGPLCGGTSSPCYDMLLVRFAADGTEEWATPVTNLSDSLSGYDDGARFVWGNYQHHGRIAFDGQNYAAYFCIGITVQNGACVDIHEGDRMQVVSASGEPVQHEQAFEFGCSHSWTTRIVWDPRANEFVMVCATDNPDPDSAGSGVGLGCRIARPAPYRTIAATDCSGQFWGGDLALDQSTGYWTAYTQNGAIQLAHFTESGTDRGIGDVGSADHAKLVGYGPGHMLLAWESGQAMVARVLDSQSGAALSSELAIDVRDHNYQSLESYPDGSVAYPASGSTSTTLSIARVMPCQ